MNNEILSICPKCNQVIMKKIELELVADIKQKGIFKFLTKCPHCKQSVNIKVEIKVKTEFI